MCQLSGSLIHIFTRTTRQIEIDTICEKLISSRSNAGRKLSSIHIRPYIHTIYIALVN